MDLKEKLIVQRVTDVNTLTPNEQIRVLTDTALTEILIDNQRLARISSDSPPAPPREQVLQSIIANSGSAKQVSTPRPRPRRNWRIAASLAAAAMIIVTLLFWITPESMLLNLRGQTAWAAVDSTVLSYQLDFSDQYRDGVFGDNKHPINQVIRKTHQWNILNSNPYPAELSTAAIDLKLIKPFTRKPISQFKYEEIDGVLHATPAITFRPSYTIRFDVILLTTSDDVVESFIRQLDDIGGLHEPYRTPACFYYNSTDGGDSYLNRRVLIDGREFNFPRDFDSEEAAKLTGWLDLEPGVCNVIVSHEQAGHGEAGLSGVTTIELDADGTAVISHVLEKATAELAPANMTGPWSITLPSDEVPRGAELLELLSKVKPDDHYLTTSVPDYLLPIDRKVLLLDILPRELWMAKLQPVVGTDLTSDEFHTNVQEYDRIEAVFAGWQEDYPSSYGVLRPVRVGTLTGQAWVELAQWETEGQTDLLARLKALGYTPSEEFRMLLLTGTTVNLSSSSARGLRDNERLQEPPQNVDGYLINCPLIDPKLIEKAEEAGLDSPQGQATLKDCWRRADLVHDAIEESLAQHPAWQKLVHSAVFQYLDSEYGPVGVITPFDHHLTESREDPVRSVQVRVLSDEPELINLIWNSVHSLDELYSSPQKHEMTFDLRDYQTE